MSDDERRLDTRHPSQADEFLFVMAAAPNTINMGSGRDDRRVDNMLHARDSGEAPSVCSTAAPMNSSSSRDKPRESFRTSQSRLMRVPEDDERSQKELHRDEFSSRRRKSRSRSRSKTPPRRRRSGSSSSESCDIDLTRRRSSPSPPPPREPSPIFLKSAHRNEDDSPLHRRPAQSSSSRKEKDDRRSRASTSSSSSRSKESQRRSSTKKQETPYERTLREFMSPSSEAPPPPPPVKRRELSIVSAARSVRSAVESSVSHPNHTASVYRRDRNRDRYSTHSRRRRSSNDTRMMEIERENKMELLIELEKLQAMGVNLSFQLSMDQPEWKLRHELERRLAHQTLVQRITLVKGILKLGSMVVRWVCSSFLRLDGWDKFIAQELDSGRYDAPLEQVYRSMFRKGTPNPWFSLGLLVFGSAIAFHVGSVMSNGQAATSGPSGPGGMINTILSSLFGSSGGNSGGGGGGSPFGFVANMLRSAGTPPTPAAPAAPQQAPTPPPARPPSPPPARPDTEASMRTRTRPRIAPPSL